MRKREVPALIPIICSMLLCACMPNVESKPQDPAEAEYVYTLPDDYYEKVTKILAKYDLVFRYEYSVYNFSSGVYDNHENGYFGFGDRRPDYSEPDSEDDYVDIYVEYDDGGRFGIETQKKSEIEAMQPMLTELIWIAVIVIEIILIVKIVKMINTVKSM